MALHAFPRLFLRFRHVHLNRNAEFPGNIRHRPNGLLIVRVFRMEAGIGVNPTIFKSVVHENQILHVLEGRILFRRRSGEIRYGMTDVALHSAFRNAANHIIAEHVHIRGGNNAVTDGFCHGQEGAPIHALAVQLRLKRENPVVQPLIQRKVLSITPHQTHGGMAVGVVESR